MSALSRVGISGSAGPAGSEVESVDEPHDESSWAPMTRCDPPQDGSGVLLDHHTGRKLVTQPRKEPPRALRHPRLVAATRPPNCASGTPDDYGASRLRLSHRPQRFLSAVGVSSV